MDFVKILKKDIELKPIFWTLTLYEVVVENKDRR